MEIVKLPQSKDIEKARKEAIDIINKCAAFVVGYRWYKDEIYGWCQGNAACTDMIVIGNLISAQGIHDMDKDL